jgi:hypothetical protein
VLEIPSGGTDFNNFPVKEDFIKELYLPQLYKTEEEGLMAKKIMEAFYDSTKLFFEDRLKDFDHIGFYPFNIAKYNPGGRMNYHVDYQEARYNIPDDKMHVTAVFYLNDNYTGGEISFIEFNKNEEIIWDFSYKPQAGDIIVFSSKAPIYHGVEKLESGNKYIIRTYWRQKSPVTQE